MALKWNSGELRDFAGGAFGCWPRTPQNSWMQTEGNGGASGIRTHVRLSPKHAFQACAFNHSATAPALACPPGPGNGRRGGPLDPARLTVPPEERGIY